MKGKAYFLSFVEECVMDTVYFDYVGGRVEVYENRGGPYAIEEIRFMTKKLNIYHKLRGRYDFKDVTLRQLNRLKKELANLDD